MSHSDTIVDRSSTRGGEIRGRLLLVGDPRRLSTDLSRVLARRGFEVERVRGGEEALAHLADEEVDAVVAELSLPDLPATTLCERIQEGHRDLPVLVLTDRPTFDTSVAALRAGAYDYLVWPIPVETLAVSLDRAIQHRRLKREVRRLRRKLRHDQRPAMLLGESPAMLRVFDTLRRIADSRAPVLVVGETGTGKELVARALHQRSPRAQGPFVAVNCAAIPDNLLESELFGHVRGAFTDAKAARKGLFVRAGGGTLFLDEIGELPLVLQAKLLRALQDRVVRPIGSDDEVTYDARIVAASNRDIEEMVDKGTFRRDLYYRLDVLQVELPPLRARAGDILLLAQHFLERAAQHSGKGVQGISPAAARRLLDYGWPGNIRELENCIERAVAFTSHDELTVDDLPARVRNSRSSHVLVAAGSPEELVSLRLMEERYVRRVLQATGDNKAAAARILGIERKTLYRKLEGFERDPPDRDL